MNPVQRFFPLEARLRRGSCATAIAAWCLLGLLLAGGASAATAPAKRKWASSLPSSAPARRQVRSLTYDELKQHIGERMLITTIYGVLRDVVIESYSSQELVVRTRVVGGYATQHIQRSQIRSIRDPE